LLKPGRFMQAVASCWFCWNCMHLLEFGFSCRSGNLLCFYQIVRVWLVLTAIGKNLM
jgi:hypothetical protein